MYIINHNLLYILENRVLLLRIYYFVPSNLLIFFLLNFVLNALPYCPELPDRQKNSGVILDSLSIKLKALSMIYLLILIENIFPRSFDVLLILGLDKTCYQERF